MRDNIKAAFDRVHAGEALKARTRRYVYARTGGYRQRAPRFALVAAVACALVLLSGGGAYCAYAVPVAAISMDVNPSVQLEVNLLDRVIRATGYNDDGIALLDGLDLTHMAYPDALNALLEDETLAACLQAGEELVITVVSGSEQRSAAIQSCIVARTGIAPEQIHCSGHREDIADAHAAGLSCGKYQAYLAWLALDPTVTVEDVQGLTMREIRERIEQAQSGAAAPGGSGAADGYGGGSGGESGGHGGGNGDHGHGYDHGHD